MAAKDGNARGVLIVIMGTSGTGKSTLGMSLSERFGIPFVDGDDLHPQANVDKMTAGRPLDDEDRLPWLVRIRHAAFELTDDATAVSTVVRNAERERAEQASEADDGSGHEEHKENVRRLAEVLETSKQPDAEETSSGEETSRSRTPPAPATPTQSTLDTEGPPPAPRRACLIACSALKRKYRDLLRCHLRNEDYPSDQSSPTLYQGQCLDVYYLYIRVPEEELVRRMHERKGHFMKESMLRSQLQTLEEPNEDKEPGVLVLDGVGSKDEVEQRAEELIKTRVGAVVGPSSREGRP